MSALLIYLTSTVLVTLGLVTILSRYFKISFLQKVLISFSILFSVNAILPSISNFFSFDIVHGADHLYSFSRTREESIERGVFVCDLRLPQNPLILNDSMSIKIEKAWIEKTWRRDYWFWTTIAGNGDYNITIIAPEVKGNWLIKKNSSNGFGRDVLGYLDGEFSGYVRNLQESDTLTYYVLVRDEFNFADENIIGEIKFVLDRP